MNTTSDLVSAVGQLAQARVLCIGDLMLDRFVYGQVDRVSPEAPIPVVNVEREIAMLGGAGNVVRNLVALGVETCFISVIGDDPAGREVTQLVGAEIGNQLLRRAEEALRDHTVMILSDYGKGVLDVAAVEALIAAARANRV